MHATIPSPSPSISLFHSGHVAAALSHYHSLPQASQANNQMNACSGDGSGSDAAVENN